MSKILRVGNLATTVTAPKLVELGSEYGKVAEARIAESPLNGKSRGFGYIEMSSEVDAAACVAGLHEKECEGQRLNVALAPADQFKKPRRRKS